MSKSKGPKDELPPVAQIVAEPAPPAAEPAPPAAPAPGPADSWSARAVFSIPAEWLEELEKSAGKVVERVVRSCVLFEHTETAGLVNIVVLAAYRAGGELVELRYPCGLAVGRQLGGQQQQEVEQTLALIRDKVGALGLENRGGRYAKP